MSDLFHAILRMTLYNRIEEERDSGGKVCDDLWGGYVMHLIFIGTENEILLRGERKKGLSVIQRAVKKECYRLLCVLS